MGSENGKPSVGSQLEGVASVNSDAREAGSKWPQEAIDEEMIERVSDDYDWRSALSSHDRAGE